MENKQNETQKQDQEEQFDDDETDFVSFCTADGFELPPEAVGSCLMALEYEKQLMEEKEKEMAAAASSSHVKSENENNNNNVGDVSEILSSLNQRVSDSVATAKIMNEKTAADQEKLIEKRREEEEKLFEQENLSFSESTGNEKEQQQQQEQQNAEEEDEYFEGDDESSMQEGMINSQSAEYFEREETDAKDWILENILLRKSVKLSEDQDEDYDVEDDDPRAVGHSATSKKKQKKEFSYLCSWRGGRIKTWELRSVLLEDGFAVLVDTYDQKITQKGISAPKPRTEAYKQTMYPNKISGMGKLPTMPPIIYPRPPTVSALEPHQLFFEALMPNFEQEITRSMCDSRILPRRIINIAPKEASETFIEYLKSDSSLKNYVEMVAHGTSAPCVSGIMSNGLVVPGKLNVSVKNGSAHGIKIYTTRMTCGAVGTSCGYVRGYEPGCEAMFICVAVVNDATRYNTWALFDEEKMIVPVWLVQYSWNYCSIRNRQLDQGDFSSPPPMERFYIYNEFSQLSPLPPAEQIRLWKQKMAVEFGFGGELNSASVCLKKKKKLLRKKHLLQQLSLRQ